VAKVVWEVEASGAFLREGGPGKEPPLILIQLSVESREHLFISLSEITDLGTCSSERHEVGL
jgi:hypothetical protein